MVFALPNKKIKIAFAFFGVLLFSLALWAFVLEPQSFRIVVHDLAIPKFDQLPKGYKVAVLADLHVGAPFVGLSKLEKIVTETNLQSPDLVLLAGDFDPRDQSTKGWTRGWTNRASFGFLLCASEVSSASGRLIPS